MNWILYLCYNFFTWLQLLLLHYCHTIHIGCLTFALQELILVFIKPCSTRLKGSNCQLCDKSKKKSAHFVKASLSNTLVILIVPFKILGVQRRPMLRLEMSKDALLGKSQV